MSFMRFRGAAGYHERVDALETANFGAMAYPTNWRTRAQRRTSNLRWVMGALAATMTVAVVVALLYIGISNERGQVTDKAAVSHASGNSCVHFRTSMLQVIVLPDVGLAMVSPKIVSHNLEMVSAKETIEIPACAGKSIHRERYSAVSVRYVRPDQWPFALKKNSLTLTKEQAVCVQHAMDEFNGKIDCEST